MSKLFSTVRYNKPKTNVFNLGHEKKLSCNMGELIPIMTQEVIPGDKFKVNTEMLLRLAPMVSPMMHRVNVYTHYFFVPNRLVWDNWQTFITGGIDGLQNPAFPVLTLNEANKAQFQVGLLADYMGVVVPPAGTITQAQSINALPFRAYQLIWNEYFRDQTLNTASAITKNDTVAGGEHTELTTLRFRAWEKDYFTSALPWTQRGGSVTLPQTINYKTNPPFSYTTTPANDAPIVVNGAANPTTVKAAAGSSNVITKIDNLNGVDIAVNDLRRAIKLQEWLERNARAGSRYIEQIMSHFGVQSSDARLQRPEYLGGGKTPVVVSEVVSTVKETTNPQGTMSGHGLGIGNNDGFNKSFEEHGFIIGMLSVLPKTAYQQGIPRKFQKADRYDYFWPEFANIGEQAILNKELYYSYNTATNDNVFGYTPRYAEYKYEPSTVHGDFKTTLNFWHMGRIFASAPVLNSAFVLSDPTNRIFAVVDSSDHVWIQLYNNVIARRPMPKFGTPTL